MIKANGITCLLILFSILFSGCLDEGPVDSDDTGEDDIKLIKQETLFLDETEYGFTNISYVVEYHGSGWKREKFLNISMTFDDEEERLNVITIDYWSSGGGGGGPLSYDSIDDIYYYFRSFDFGYFDFWILFYEKGNRTWDEYNKTYYDKSVLKKTLPFTIANIPEEYNDNPGIGIRDVSWYFDEQDPEVFNVTFNISSKLLIRDLKIHYTMFGGPGRSGSTYQEDDMINETYIKSIEITQEMKDRKSLLLFCLAGSDPYGKREITDIFQVPI